MCFGGVTVARRRQALERASVARAGSLEAPERVAVVLTAVATILLVASLGVARLQLDGYGLAGSLPVTYHLGLALLPAASAILWVRGRATAPILVAQLVLFVLVVWLTPLVLEGTPRFRTSYLSYGYVDPIVRGEGLLPGRLVPHNWPLFPLASGALVDVLGVPRLALLGWFPAVVMLLYLVPLGGLLRLASAPLRSRVPNAWAAGLWLFLAFDWTGQDAFSPEAIAYLFFLGWALLLGQVALRGGGRFTAGQLILALVFFAAIVVTHALTSLLALGALVALTLTRFVRRPTLVIACGLIFVAWHVTAAAPFLAAHGDRPVDALLAADDVPHLNVANRVAGSHEHRLVVALRVVAALVVANLGLLGVLRFGSPRRWPRETRFAVAFLLGIAIVAPISAYGGEMVIRVLLFSLPALAVAGVRALGAGVVRLALLASLVVFAPLHVITHYGNESYDHVSRDEIAGFEFVAAELPPANVYGAFPAGALRPTALDWRDAFLRAPAEPLTVQAFLRPNEHDWLHRDWPVYVALSRGDAAAADLFYDDETFVPRLLERLAADGRFEVVYQNPDIRILRWLGPPPPAPQPEPPP